MDDDVQTFLSNSVCSKIGDNTWSSFREAEKQHVRCDKHRQDLLQKHKLASSSTLGTSREGQVTHYLQRKQHTKLIPNIETVFSAAPIGWEVVGVSGDGVELTFWVKHLILSAR